MNFRRHLPAQLALGLAASNAKAQAPRGHAALLACYVALKNAGDATRCQEIYEEDYQEHSGRSASGLAALVANWQAQFQQAPDLRVALEDQVTEGDKVVGRFTYSGTHTQPLLGIPPSGRRFSFGSIDIWRVRGGRFAAHWDQVDFAGLMRQLRG